MIVSGGRRTPDGEKSSGTRPESRRSRAGARSRRSTAVRDKTAGSDKSKKRDRQERWLVAHALHLGEKPPSLEQQT